jgi:hypothetical protein
MQRNDSWRQLVRKHGPSFLKWLVACEKETKFVQMLGTQLEKALVSRISRPEEALQFWNQIPPVRAACNEPNVFDEHLASIQCNHPGTVIMHGDCDRYRGPDC